MEGSSGGPTFHIVHGVYIVKLRGWHQKPFVVELHALLLPKWEAWMLQAIP